MARRRKTHQSRSGAAAGDAAVGAAVSERAAGWTTLLVGLAVTGYLFVANQRYMAFEQYYLLNIALLLWAPLVVILVFLRRPPDDFALTTGDLRSGSLVALVLFVLFLPVIFVTAPTPPFQHYYVNALLRAPQGSGAISAFGRLDVGRLIFHETVFGFYMFAWEWYFRGFLLYGLKRLMPTVAAVLLQACAFALLHYNKPLIEVVSSFFGAILLASVALRYRSFLPCFFLHWAISAAFDGAVLYHFLHAGAAPGGFRP